MKQPVTAVADLCREWQRIYEANPESDRLVDENGSRIVEIEETLVASVPETIDDLQGILGVVIENMDGDDMGAPRDRGMVMVVHAALNRLRDKPSTQAGPSR